MMNEQRAAGIDPLPSAFYQAPRPSFVDHPFADNRQACYHKASIGGACALIET
jgi:hypothetical protein